MIQCEKDDIFIQEYLDCKLFLDNIVEELFKRIHNMMNEISCYKEGLDKYKNTVIEHINKN